MLELLAAGADAAHEVAVQGAEHHEEAMAFGLPFLTPGGVVAIAMLVVILIALRAGVPGIIARVLDDRIAGIRRQLDEATALRAEAQALRDEYVRKAAKADKEIASVRANAEKQAADILEQAKADATAMIERHKSLATAKIAAAERHAIDELRTKAAEAAAVAARELLGKQLDEATDRKLVDKAIADI